MIFSMRSALIFGATVGAFTTLVSTNANASGSESMSNGPNSDTRLYNAGKAVYADKFSCSGCPLADKSLNAELARDVLAGKPKVELSKEEADALAAYLKRRFRV
jgi:hypothetical protein